MELMSFPLLCALVALVPQAFGISSTRVLYRTDVKFNNTMLIQEKPMGHKKVLLNLSAPPLVNKVNELQAVFIDRECTNCTGCIERTLKAYNAHFHTASDRPRVDDIYNDVLASQNFYSYRNKRYIIETATTNTTQSKKNNVVKYSMVTKYYTGNEVYALKVKEMNTQAPSARKGDSKAATTTCQVYNVKRSFPCDSPEGDLISRVAKRKVNKKGKRKITTKKAKSITPSFKKHHVDNTHVLENFMTSIEEQYER